MGKFVVWTWIVALVALSGPAAAATEIFVKDLERVYFGQDCTPVMDKQQAYDLALSIGYSEEQSAARSFNYFNQQRFDFAKSIGADDQTANNFANAIYLNGKCWDI